MVGMRPTVPIKGIRLERRSDRETTVRICEAFCVDMSRKYVLHLLYKFRKGETMAYSFTNSKGTTYYLHTKKSMTSTGKERTLFYFSKEVKEGESLDAVPAGYTVAEMKTGLPVLKKSDGNSAEVPSE